MDRALLVGINKYPSSPLRGCVNDVTDMANHLVARCGFAHGDIRLLVDERATAAAIVGRLTWLVSGARPGDRLFFHFSGHGTQLPTRDPAGEVDRLDEVICPVDFDWTDARAIRDKDFRRIFGAVPTGVQFVWVSDSCNSGDLSRAIAPPGAGGPRVARYLAPPADIEWRLQTALRERRVFPLRFTESADGMNFGLVTGCRSDQTSSDAVFDGRYNGALTYHLLRHLSTGDGGAQTLATIVDRIRKSLAAESFTQEPQLEGSDWVRGRPFMRAVAATPAAAGTVGGRKTKTPGRGGRTAATAPRDAAAPDLYIIVYESLEMAIRERHGLHPMNPDWVPTGDEIGISDSDEGLGAWNEDIKLVNVNMRKRGFHFKWGLNDFLEPTMRAPLHITISEIERRATPLP